MIVVLTFHPFFVFLRHTHITVLHSKHFNQSMNYIVTRLLLLTSSKKKICYKGEGHFKSDLKMITIALE